MKPTIPKEISDMVRAGIWPADGQTAGRQDVQPVIAADTIRVFAPEESGLYLYPPPFHAVQDEIDNDKNPFWSDPRSATTEIDPRLAIIIGDFGIGSDAAIILDYRLSLSEPRVMRLRWSESGNHWVECAKTFAEFAGYLRTSKQNTEQTHAGVAKPPPDD